MAVAAWLRPVGRLGFSRRRSPRTPFGQPVYRGDRSIQQAGRGLTPVRSDAITPA